MTRICLSVAISCLFSALCLAGETSKKPATGKPKTRKLSPKGQKHLDEGRKLFEAGKFKEALAEFETAFEEDPGDMNVNWFLGRAAYETKDFETAVMAFERMLVIDPKAQRVRLELGRSYFMLGLHELAKQEFVKVLDDNPPAAVQQNIRSFMGLMDKTQKRHYISGMINVTTSWDNNPLYSPGSDEIKTVLGNVLLDQTVREDNDTFQAATGVLQHKYRLGDRGFFVKSSAVLYGTMYDEQSDQNVMFGNASTGLAYETKTTAWEMAFTYSHLTKDDDEYVNIRGVKASVTRAFSPKFIGNLTLRGDKKKYRPLLEYKDAENRDITTRGMIILGKNRIPLNIGFEVENADDRTESYENLHMGMGYQRDLPWGLVAAGNYNFKVMDYAKDLDLFGKARHEEIHDISVSLTKKIGKHFEVSVSHAWTETYTNIEIYEYDRRVLTVGATFKF